MSRYTKWIITGQAFEKNRIRELRYMAFSDFKNIGEVQKKYNIKYKEDVFINVLSGFRKVYPTMMFSPEHPIIFFPKSLYWERPYWKNR